MYLLAIFCCISIMLIHVSLLFLFNPSKINNEESKSIVYENTPIDTTTTLSEMINFHKNNTIVEYEI